MPGPYCTFQGVVLQVGLLAQAVWTFVVALSTFLLIAGGNKCQVWMSEKGASGKGRWVFVVVLWAFIWLIALFGLIFIQPLHPGRGAYC